MSIFEAVMLVCFGAAWPISIWKSYTSRTNRGKSLWFLLIVLSGYVSGTLHKIHYNPDPVMALYIFNGVMVFMDVCLYARNRRIESRQNV
jgi:lipopolysaccharide export LptBFGC system permease protein LptF